MAAAESRLEEHAGGRLEWGLRSAWAHTLGLPRGRDEPARLQRLKEWLRSEYANGTVAVGLAEANHWGRPAAASIVWF